ncbi:MAG: M28 family peptidase [Promethearchaeota archaeon]
MNAKNKPHYSSLINKIKDTTKKNIDFIYQFNKELSFPRRNDGTEGHEKAIGIIESKLEDIGVNYVEEEFYWKDFRKRKIFTQNIPLLILSLRLLIGSIMILFHDPELISGFWWYVWFFEPTWIMIFCAVILLCWWASIYSDWVKPTTASMFKLNNDVEKLKKLNKSNKPLLNKIKTGKNIIVEFGKNATTLKSNKIDLNQIANQTAKDPNKYNSENKNSLIKPLILIMAHYDSISGQFRPIFHNIIYLRMATIPFSAIFALITLPFSMQIGPANLLIKFGAILAIMASAFSVFSFIASFFNKWTNESDGAFDNASGCATLIGVIKNLVDIANSNINNEISDKVANVATVDKDMNNILKNLNSLKDLPIDIKFIFIDCEEEGLLGSHAYFIKHMEELTDPIYKKFIKVISLDGTGGDPKLGLFSKYGMPRVINAARSLKKEFKKFGHELFNERIPSLWAPYASSDHAVFGEYGIESIQIFSKGFTSNTKYDTFDFIKKETLEKTTNLMTLFILKKILNLR